MSLEALAWISCLQIQLRSSIFLLTASQNKRAGGKNAGFGEFWSEKTCSSVFQSAK